MGKRGRKGDDRAPPAERIGGDGILVVFRVAERAFALPLATVERVVRAVAVTRLEQVPGIILGVIDVGGTLVPVADPGQRFGLPPRVTDDPDAHMLLASTPRRTFALLVDAVSDVIEVPPADVSRAGDAVDVPAPVAGIARAGGELIVINDLDGLLSAEDEARIEDAIRRLEA